MNTTKAKTVVKERRFSNRQKAHDSICCELEKLIEKYGFKDVRYAFGDVTSPILADIMLEGSTSSIQGIEQLWGENLDERAIRQRPPKDDHALLLKDEKTGEPYCYLSQPYNLNLEALKAIVELCDSKKLVVRMTGQSFHYPSKTLSVLYFKKGVS